MTNSRFCLRFVWAVYVLWFQSPSAMCNQSPSPFGYSLLGLRGRVFVWYSLKLLRFCKEEVSRSDGGDSANALFVFWADTSVRPYGWVLSFLVIVGADRCVCPLLCLFLKLVYKKMRITPAQSGLIGIPRGITYVYATCD